MPLEQTHPWRTTWRAPVSVQVVWVGEMSAGKVLWYWNQVTGLTAHIGLPRLPFLGDGIRGEGLGIPSPLLWVLLLLLSRQEWFWRVRSSSATWSGWLLQVAGWRTWCVGVPGSLWSSLLLGGERSRCASCSGYGCLCDHTAYVPAVV